jgi:hypothetical protein
MVSRIENIQCTDSRVRIVALYLSFSPKMLKILAVSPLAATPGSSKITSHNPGARSTSTAEPTQAQCMLCPPAVQLDIPLAKPCKPRCDLHSSPPNSLRLVILDPHAPSSQSPFLHQFISKCPHLPNHALSHQNFPPSNQKPFFTSIPLPLHLLPPPWA